MKKAFSVTSKVLIGVGALALGNVIAGICIGKNNLKKIEKTENQNNFVHTEILKKGKVCVSADVDNAYITCISGMMDITIPKPEHNKMYVEVTSFFSNLRISVPENVRVIYDGTCGIKTIRDTAMFPDIESLTEIHIVIKSKYSKVDFKKTENK